MLKPNPSNNNSVAKLLVFNNVTYSDELDIVQIFNEHFSIGAKKFHDYRPIATTGINFASYLADIPSHEPFRFASVSPTVIENTIMSLKNKSKILVTYSVGALKTIKSLVSPI